jgi:MerR family mercuric resistance operon transcriptional regulator
MVRSQVGQQLTIGKLAAAADVGVETVRFYQRKGLLAVPARSAGVRTYGDDAIRRLRFIRHAQAAGFTLAEIKELLTLDAGEDRSRARALAQTRIAALEAKIVDLERARSSLLRLAKACSEGTSGPCPILTAFEPQTQRTKRDSPRQE